MPAQRPESGAAEEEDDDHAEEAHRADERGVVPRNLQPQEGAEGIVRTSRNVHGRSWRRWRLRWWSWPGVARGVAGVGQGE